jgi:hypothetical protein
MRVLGRAFVAAAFACSVIVVAAAARADRSFGAVYLTTLPDGADVWVDGTYMGRSPVLVDALSSGHHMVTLTKTGWVTREIDVTVPAGATAMSSWRLAAAHQAGGARGAVTFRSLDPGARVVVDGELVTRDPQGVVPMSTGSHIAMVTSGGAKLARAFTVYPNTTTQVIVRSIAHDEQKSAVVAPAEEYLPDEAYKVDGRKVTVHYGGHVVVGRIGEMPMRFDGVTISYDVAPSRIGGRLYLPLALLTRLTETKTK